MVYIMIWQRTKQVYSRREIVNIIFTLSTHSTVYIPNMRFHLLNNFIFIKWNQNFNKVKRLEWKRIDARKKHALLNFFFKCHFHAFLSGARTHDFAKQFHIYQMKSKFLTKLKDWNENAQAEGKDMHWWFFFSSIKIDLKLFYLNFGRRTHARKKWHITQILILGLFTSIGKLQRRLYVIHNCLFLYIHDTIQF